MLLFESKDYNPYKNLALEEYLVERQASLNEPILFIWQNDKTVVIGRNQDFYSECNERFIRNSNITVARRKTGGGAVYHDLGNINFSFICLNNEYDRNQVMIVVKDSLIELGINAVINGRNDIEVNGYKVSGHAFLKNEINTLHHGTIMLNVDLEMMEKSLSNGKSKLIQKGIKSVKSRVANLIQFKDDLTAGKIIKSLINHFSLLYGRVKRQETPALNDYKSLLEFYNNPGWVFNEITSNDKKESFVFDWGKVSVSIFYKDDKISKITVESDSLFSEEISAFNNKCNESIDELQIFLKSSDFKGIQLDLAKSIIGLIS